MSKQSSKIAATYKSADTEEPIDIYFYRPIGYWWALLAKRLHITPNAITIVSIFIGAFAGFLFYQPDLLINIAGMFLLMLANSLDSADGQLARMTNNKTKLGRILDGLAGDVWFIIIYVVLVLRCLNQGWDSSLVWSVGILAGLSHIAHASTADYYRNIHLYFLHYGKGGEFDNTRQIKEEIKSISWRSSIKKIMLFFYFGYTNQQEMLTPRFQKFIAKIHRTYPDGELPKTLCETFRAQSKPLMKYTNMLQFNMRVIALFICLFLNQPFYYFLFDLVVMNAIMVYMIIRHEKMSSRLISIIA